MSARSWPGLTGGDPRTIWVCGRMCWMPAESFGDVIVITVNVTAGDCCGELGEEQDLRVLHMAASGGCSLLATVHGAGEEDAARRLGGEYMREMFARIVILKGRGRMECRCLEGG